MLLDLKEAPEWITSFDLTVAEQHEVFTAFLQGDETDKYPAELLQHLVETGKISSAYRPRLASRSRNGWTFIR